MNINELKKKKLTLRKTEPFRSGVYSNILDGAGKIAKLENRNMDEKDIISACKKSIKNLSSTIELVKEGDVVDAYKKEVEILKEFLPNMLSNEKMETIIDTIIYEMLEEERTMKNMGRVIGQVKAKCGDTADMSMVSKMIKEKLK